MPIEVFSYGDNQKCPTHFPTLAASGTNSYLKHWNDWGCCWNDWTMLAFFPVAYIGDRIPSPRMHHVVALPPQVQRVIEHFQAHRRPSQTIQRGSMGSHANRHRWGGTPALSYWFTNYTLSSVYPLLYSIWFPNPLSTVFVFLPHLYYPGFILFLEMLKPLNSYGKTQNQRDLYN